MNITHSVYGRGGGGDVGVWVCIAPFLMGQFYNIIASHMRNVWIYAFILCKKDAR